MTTLLDTLTAEQLAAVTATKDWIHVSAGPGTGKTRTIAARASWLLEQGVVPKEIIILTFTRSACENIRSRIAGQVGPVAHGVSIWTFHEAALKLGPSLGGLRIATDAEVDAAIRSLYKGPMRRPGFRLPNLTNLRSAITRWEAAGGAAGSGFELHDITAISLVRGRLHDAGLIPLWELIPRLLDKDHVLHFDHVLIDEGQDTTHSEYRMANRLSASAIYSVGDMRQAIMGWRGAWPELWGEPTHYLTHTFRFGCSIAKLSNSLEVGPPIQGSSDVISGVMAGPELADIEPYIQDLQEDTAILTRTHSDAAAIAAAYPEQVQHVQRDPLDPLSETADRISAATQVGKMPVLTVHSAKGREWDTVIVIGPSTIRWGFASEDPEERRVMYVALTRARRRLILITRDPELPGWRTRASGLIYKGNGEEGNS
jgi:hypothetical protein